MIQHLNGRAHVAPGGVNIGVVFAGDDQAILIDTGLNDTSVRKVLRHLRDCGRTVSSIVTTHGHADHFGGNAFAVKRTGARVYAPAWDETVLRYPLFQPLTLFAGADPPQSMRGSFMVADASPVDVIYEAGDLMVDGVMFQVIGLPGHSGNQMGLLVDDVFYCADVVLPGRVLELYRMPYLYSARDHIQSLQVAAGVNLVAAVPGHGPIVDDVRPLVQQNLEIVHDVADRIVKIAAAPAMPEDILAEVLDQLGANPQDPAAYYLLHPTVFAFLTYLEADGRLVHRIERGRSLWQATGA